MLIYAFCKICEREIVFLYFLRLLFVLIIKTITQTVIFLYKDRKKYGSVSYSFSCSRSNYGKTGFLPGISILTPLKYILDGPSGMPA